MALSKVADIAFAVTESGAIPDAIVRAGIRRLIRARLEEIDAGGAEKGAARAEDFVSGMLASPIALVPEKANEQHYEVPAAFFGHVLGRQRKYSCAWWPAGVGTLDEAEAAALDATVQRADLRDGQRILELGCGWGSLTLRMAERFPDSRVTALSNSHSQRRHIEREATQRGLRNVEVVTANVGEFEPGRRFDRIVSVEMFEHLRNWRAMFARVARWLEADGRFFMHVFVHRSTPYAFEGRDANDWMARHFFSGGMMPSDDLALLIQDDLRIVRRWRWDGTHYEKTANAWLANLDGSRGEALRVLAKSHGPDEAALWLQRWRLFFMACAELFGHRDGQEWWVSHYLFERPA